MTKFRNFLFPICITTLQRAKLLTKVKKIYFFLLSFHIRTAECRLLSWKGKKSIFLLSTSYLYRKCPIASKIRNIFEISSFTPYLSSNSPYHDFFEKFLVIFSQSKNTVHFFLYGGVYPVLYIRFFQL